MSMYLTCSNSLTSQHTSMAIIHNVWYRAIPHVASRLFIAEAMFRYITNHLAPPIGLRPVLYYTTCLRLTIQWQLLCQLQGIVGLVCKWVLWGCSESFGGGGGGGGGVQPPEPRGSAPGEPLNAQRMQDDAHKQPIYTIISCYPIILLFHT